MQKAPELAGLLLDEVGLRLEGLDLEDLLGGII